MTSQRTPERPLTDRENTVLHYVIHDFIQTASPVGSRYISRRHEDVGLSSASIRNIMSDLEYLGYINHPHTSAGRIPTDLGYRYYLDHLVKMEAVPKDQADSIRRDLDIVEEQETLLRESGRLLSRISRQLCIVTAPELSSGIFERLEMVQISSSRIMVVLSIKSGLVRTIMLEVDSEISREKLDDMARFLNERLAGLSIREVRETFAERFREVQDEDGGLIRLFIDSVDKIFLANKREELHISGTDNILEHPEFGRPGDFRGIIELINNEEIIIHLLEKNETRPHEVHVSIGSENLDEKLSPFTVITSSYTVGDVTGNIGVIGPKRMPYSWTIPLVDYVARTVSEMFQSPRT